MQFDPFQALNYAEVAMSGAPHLWQTHAARALVRGRASDIASLDAYEGEEVRLHQAAACFIAGDDDAAIRLLSDLSGAHARNLLALIRKPRIQVLAQLPWTRKAPHDLLSAAARDEKFEVRNLSFHPDDLPNEPYADVRNYVDSAFDPDFYISAMVEWHLLPPNLRALGCPILGHTADYDLHAQAVYPWLGLFDELITTDPGEWSDVHSLGLCPVSSFPKVFGLPDDLPALEERPRSLDLFVSGTMLDPMHPDKVQRMHEVLSIPDAEIRVLRGFVSSSTYHGLLASSKVSFSYIRRPGATSTRGLETLAMGCALALQRESIMNLFVGEAEGVRTYGPEPGSLAACIKDILGDSDRMLSAARRGSEVVRREFSQTRVASHYLRYLVFRAAAPRSERRLREPDELIQKRPMMRLGWLPDSAADRRLVMLANVRRLNAAMSAAPSANTINDLAREILLEAVPDRRRSAACKAEPELLANALHVLRRGAESFPHCLALRFNLFRVLYHYGSEAERAEALEMARQLLVSDEKLWELDVLADVMPLDFFGQLFNYRSYFDLVTRELAPVGRDGGTIVAPRSERIALVLASLAAYLARATGGLAWHEKAVALDPTFARYRLDLAKALLQDGPESGRCVDAARSADRRRAGALLAELANGSIVFDEACALLEQLVADGVEVDRPLEPLCVAARRVRETSIAIRNRVHALEPDVAPAEIVRDRRDPTSLSVLIPELGSKAELVALLIDLGCQTLARELEVVVAVPRNRQDLGAIAEAQRTSLPGIRCIGVSDQTSYVSRVNDCVRAASGRLLTVALPGDRFRSDCYERRCTALTARPDVALVYADEAETKDSRGRFALERVTCYRFAPDFSRRRLFESDYVGFHAIWRASLHERYGLFTESLGAVAAYEFWLRVVPSEMFERHAGVLSSSRSDADWRRLRETQLAPDAAARVARERWPHRWGRVGGYSPMAPLPAALFSQSIRDEARSYVQLGILNARDAEDVCGAVVFYQYALARHDFTCAEVALRSAIERYSMVMGLRLALAELRRYREGTGACLAELEAARGCNPFGVVLEKRRAVCLHELGELGQAERLLEDAHREHPRDIGVLLSLGAICLDRGCSGEARGHFEKVLQLAPWDPNGLAGVAITNHENPGTRPVSTGSSHEILEPASRR